MTVIAGRYGQITVSGVVISGASKEATEAEVTIGRERAKHNAVGTDITQHLTGMRTVEGVCRRAWISGDTLFQTLLDNDVEFAVKIEGTGTYGGQNITASGCLAQTLRRRVAAGTDLIVEEMPFVGRAWY